MDHICFQYIRNFPFMQGAFLLLPSQSLRDSSPVGRAKKNAVLKSIRFLPLPLGEVAALADGEGVQSGIKKSPCGGKIDIK